MPPIRSKAARVEVPVVKATRPERPAAGSPKPAQRPLPRLPEDFFTGAATAAYQVEGAAHRGGRTDYPAEGSPLSRPTIEYKRYLCHRRLLSTGSVDYTSDCANLPRRGPLSCP